MVESMALPCMMSDLCFTLLGFTPRLRPSPAGGGGRSVPPQEGGEGSASSAFPLSSGGQKDTLTPAAASATGRAAAKVLQSLRHVGVMSLPTQDEGMRSPFAVQPGQVPKCAW